MTNMKNGVHLQGFKGYFEGTKAIDIIIIGNDIVLNVEDFLGAMINSYLLFAPYADLSYDEIAQLLEEYFCDYIAQYGIVILKLYTKKTEKGIFIDYKYNGIKKCYIYTQQF